MLRLINIKKSENTITAEYIPEDSNEVGMVELSCETSSIISCLKTDFDKTAEMYLTQAASALRKILSEPEVPKTRLVMWY